jgi:hypothetical protein
MSTATDKYPDEVPPGDRLYAWVVCGRTRGGRETRICGFVSDSSLPAAWATVRERSAADPRWPHEIGVANIHEVPLAAMPAVLRANGWTVTPPGGG